MRVRQSFVKKDVPSLILLLSHKYMCTLFVCPKKYVHSIFRKVYQSNNVGPTIHEHYFKSIPNGVLGQEHRPCRRQEHGCARHCALAEEQGDMAAFHWAVMPNLPMRDWACFYSVKLFKKNS